VITQPHYTPRDVAEALAIAVVRVASAPSRREDTGALTREIYDMLVEMRAAGGPGSGNFGHAGRPGEIGGSQSIAMFHGTSSNALDAIKKDGLKPVGGKGADTWAVEAIRQGAFFRDTTPEEEIRRLYRSRAEAIIGDRKSSVFLTEDINHAKYFARFASSEFAAGGEPVILKIVIPKEVASQRLVEDELSEDRRFKGPIPPSWVAGRVDPVTDEIKALEAGDKIIYLVFFVDRVSRTAGGVGSGNFGHAGRPGEVGGSSSDAPKMFDTTQTHYIGGVIPKNPRLPIFTTTQKSGAQWYAENRGTGGRVHAVTIQAERPFLLRNEDDAKKLLPLLDEAGVNYTFEPSKGGPGQDIAGGVGGWWLDVPEINKHSGYEGTNPLDVSYIPAVREVLVKHGYDSLQAFDPVEMDEIPTTVLIKSPSQIRGLATRALGGVGSGNFGHEGRPGEVGGSGPGAIGAVLTAIHQADGGFTYHAVTGAQPSTGYALSLHKDRERVIPNAKDLTLDDLVDYTYQNRDLLEQDSNYLGGWHNPNDGKAYLDVSTVVPSRDDAERLGREHHQLAYFDLEKGQSVDLIRVHHGRKTDSKLNRPAQGASLPRRSDRVSQATHGPRFDTGGDRARTTKDSHVRTEVVALGGPGSGNFGHEGRPGEVGGSGHGDTAATVVKSGVTLQQFHARMQDHGLKIRGIKDINPKTAEAMHLSEVTEPLPTPAVNGIMQGLDDLQRESPEFYDQLAKNVAFSYLKHDPPTAAATTATGFGEATIVFNGGGGLRSMTVADDAWSVGNRLAAGVSGDAKTQALYRGVVLHETGHIADAMLDHRISASVMSELTQESQQSGRSFEAVLQDASDHFSKYGVYGGPHELAAEVFAATVLKYDVPSYLEETRDNLDRLLRPIKQAP